MLRKEGWKFKKVITTFFSPSCNFANFWEKKTNKKMVNSSTHQDSKISAWQPETTHLHNQHVITPNRIHPRPSFSWTSVAPIMVLPITSEVFSYFLRRKFSCDGMSLFSTTRAIWSSNIICSFFLFRTAVKRKYESLQKNNSAREICVKDELFLKLSSMIEDFLENAAKFLEAMARHQVREFRTKVVMETQRPKLYAALQSVGRCLCSICVQDKTGLTLNFADRIEILFVACFAFSLAL